MKRESVNPTDWGLQFSMDQAELVEGLRRYLHCSGQISVQPDADAEMGIAIKHVGDMRGQIALCLENIDAVLLKAGMNRRNILTLRFFTTDVDLFLQHYDVYANWIQDAGTRPPQSLIGISRLALPDLLVEIEAVAGD
ncbi:MAG TPA: RidA family protein [Gammaproteobacteria bacterium]